MVGAGTVTRAAADFCVLGEERRFLLRSLWEQLTVLYKA